MVTDYMQHNETSAVVFTDQILSTIKVDRISFSVSVSAPNVYIVALSAYFRFRPKATAATFGEISVTVAVMPKVGGHRK